MKLIIEIPQTLLVPDECQAQALELLQKCRIVKSEGWSNTQYHPCDTVPKIEFIKEEQILGYKDAFKAQTIAKEKADSERSSAQYKVYKAEEKLKAVEDELAVVKASITNVIAVEVSLGEGTPE